MSKIAGQFRHPRLQPLWDGTSDGALGQGRAVHFPWAAWRAMVALHRERIVPRMGRIREAGSGSAREGASRAVPTRGLARMPCSITSEVASFSLSIAHICGAQCGESSVFSGSVSEAQGLPIRPQPEWLVAWNGQRNARTSHEPEPGIGRRLGPTSAAQDVERNVRSVA